MHDVEVNSYMQLFTSTSCMFYINSKLYIMKEDETLRQQKPSWLMQIITPTKCT